MAIETVTTLICDRCGSRHDKDKLMAGNSWGEMTVKWNGHTGGRAWNGDAGGMNYADEAWLCEHCTHAFLVFMRTNEQPKAG